MLEENRTLEERLDEARKIIRDFVIYLKPDDQDLNRKEIFRHLLSRAEALFGDLGIEAYLKMLEDYPSE